LTWGIGVVLALQALSTPTLDATFLAITQFGSAEFALLVVPLVYWCIDKRFGIRLAFLFLASVLANAVLKALFNTPRPYQVDSRVRLIGPEELSPGFPSGHAQFATTVWGALAWRAQRRQVWSLAIVIMVLVAVSRVYLGVHFPHDVLGGMLFGAIALLIFARVETAWSVRLAALPFGAHVALALVVPLMSLVVVANRDWVAATGTLSGLWIGYAVERRWVHFAVTGSTGQRALRFIAGILVVAAIYFGLRVTFGAVAGVEETPLWYILRYVRYGLVGLWASGLWPLIAVRVRLAAREEDNLGR